MKRWMVFLVGAALAMNFAACSKPQLGVSEEAMSNKTAVTGQGDFQAAIAEAQKHWEHRDSKEETQKAIDAWEKAITFDTGDLDRDKALAKVYAHLAHAYYWVGHGFDFFIDVKKDRKKALQADFKKCMSVGKLSLALNNAQWNKAMKAGEKVEDAVKYLQEDDVPAAYWYATCAGKWATLEGIAALLAYKDKIFAIVTRLADLNSDYYYNATDRYFGVVYTKIPFMHPDLDKSRDYFKSSIKAYPNYLESRVLYASELLTKTGESKLAKKQLEYVVNADASINPKIYPENKTAQHHAQDLLDHFSDYF